MTIGNHKDDEQQSKAFIETAREIGADEDQSKADALMGKLAHTPPAPKSKSGVVRKRKPPKRRLVKLA